MEIKAKDGGVNTDPPTTTTKTTTSVGTGSSESTTTTTIGPGQPGGKDPSMCHIWFPVWFAVISLYLLNNDRRW